MAYQQENQMRKTANVILVYQYIRIKENKKSSRVISLTAQHHRQSSVKGFAPPLGKPSQGKELLDSSSRERELCYGVGGAR